MQYDISEREQIGRPLEHASEIGAPVTLCHAAEIDRSVSTVSGGAIRVSVVVMER